MHSVQVRRNRGGLVETMGMMRSWLDHRDAAQYVFRIDGDVFRLEFVTEDDAEAFATAFHGHVLEPAPHR